MSMSDSETEFKSASEGSECDNGWEVDSDFDFPNIETKSSEAKLSELLSAKEVNEKSECEQKDTKLPGQSSKSDITLLSNLDRLSIDNGSFRQQVSKESKIDQNEPSCTQSSNVSKI